MGSFMSSRRSYAVESINKKTLGETKLMQINDEDEDYDVSIGYPGGKIYIPLGLTLKTTIVSEKAVHRIVRIKPSNIAQHLGLTTGMAITCICGINTDGMYQGSMKAQFQALSILEDNNNISIKLRTKKTENNVGIIQNIKADIPIDQGAIQNLKSSKEEEKAPFEQYLIKVAHRHDVRDLTMCYIEHPASNRYVVVENNQLITHTLQESTPPFTVGIFGGYVDEKPVVIILFNEKNGNETNYITAVTPDRFGLQTLPRIQNDVHILNSDDPRLFFEHKLETKSCFELTASSGLYLAVDNDGRLFLMKVDHNDLGRTAEVQFIVRYLDNVVSNKEVCCWCINR